MVRKLFRTGNSLVVSLPKEAISLLGLHEGSELEVEVDVDARRVLLSPAEPSAAGIDAEFARQLDAFILQYGHALKSLAR